MNAEQTNYDVGPGCPNNEYIFRLLVAAIEDYAVHVVEPSDNLITWNPGATRPQGYAKGDGTGRSFSIFFLPQGRKTGKPLALAALVANGRAEGNW